MSNSINQGLKAKIFEYHKNPNIICGFFRAVFRACPTFVFAIKNEKNHKYFQGKLCSPYWNINKQFDEENQDLAIFKAKMVKYNYRTINLVRCGRGELQFAPTVNGKFRIIFKVLWVYY